jgi:pyruvate kinase
MVTDPAMPQRRLDEVHANYRDSAQNLLHYLALRRHDLRPLQLRLASLGLSSLGRAESHVLATVDAVLEALHRLAGRPWQPPSPEEEIIAFADGQRLLAAHTDALLGPATPGRGVRIMVTMPSEAGDDYTLVHNLLKQGMDCMRINCAHDDAATWLRMIEHLRRAEQSLGRSCRIVMDLAGPKLRTGPLEPSPGVIRIRPRRDVYGRVTAPARVWLTSEPASYPPRQVSWGVRRNVGCRGYVCITAMVLRKRRRAPAKNTAPMTAVAANSGHTTSKPAPRYKMAWAKLTKWVDGEPCIIGGNPHCLWQ